MPSASSDIDAIVALVHDAYRGDASRVGWTTEADLLDGQRTDREEVEALVRGPDTRIVLAYADEQLVGCVQLELSSLRSRAEEPRASTGLRSRAEEPRASTGLRSRAEEPRASTGLRSRAEEPRASTGLRSRAEEPRASTGRAYVGMVSVRPALQARGVGRALLAECERIAALEQPGAKLRMTVIGQRSELIAWYERRGYRRTGERAAFPYGQPRFGLPRRADLYFEVLEKDLAQRAI